jgi:signal transduction histidine kinase
VLFIGGPLIRANWLTNPLAIFIFSLLALGTSLYIYIHSYLRVNNAFSEFVKKRNLDAVKFLDTQSWVTILILSVLVAMIICGMFIIYVYYRNMIRLYHMQQNFINGFTHELKTPIASLRLFLDTFSKHQLPQDQQQKYLNYMKRDTDRLADNVNQILNLARLEDRKYKADWKYGCLKVFAQEWLAKTSFNRENSNVEIVAVSSDFFPAKFDVQLMEMLFANLVANGLFHNRSDTPKVDIVFMHDRRMINIQFKDNGLGLAKRDFKHIFKKFYQVKKTGKGSGLGLYMVQQIARFHKGQIKVSSEGEAMGSVFTLSIPLERVSER